jgi:hypothetical protein
MKIPLRFKHLLTLALCFNLTVLGVFADDVPARIEVAVVEGEGVINNLRQRVARDPVVKVEDDGHRPVVGAAVVFTLPISGASGEFGNGSRTLIVVTDKEGLATAHGLKTNQIAGKLQIYVTASYRGLRARTLINQFDMSGPDAAPPHKGNSKVWIILAIAGAAAAGGAVAATQKGNNSGGVNPTAAAPAAISITLGTGTIGPPH